VILTEIFVPRPRDQVWDVLADFAAYPLWSPTILRVSGPVKAGVRLVVRIVGPGGRAVTFRPRLVALEPGRLLRWDAVVLHPRVLSGLHEFRLDDDGDGTRVVHSDTYSGVLARPLRGLLAANEPLMRRQNLALRDRVLSLR
jgi:hypothetical protein